MWDRHILNSVALNDLISDGLTVAEVTLIEPLLRRFSFLVEVVDELDLQGRVTVVRSRAEDHRVRYEVVTSRAVAPLARLVSWCRPLCTPGGQILALKGSAAQNEVDGMVRELDRQHLVAEVLTGRAHASADTATIIRVLTPSR